MKVLKVSGTPRERGLAIGESLREDIHAIVEKHEQSVASQPGYTVEQYFSAFDVYRKHLGAITKWAPDLLEEVNATAEAAGIEPDRFLRFQLIDEHWAFDAYHYAPGARLHNKCTAFAMVGEAGHPTYAGQNVDIPSYIEGHQVLLHIQYPNSNLESLVYTYSGSISLMGMNNAPLGINLNTLMQLGCRPDGLPIVFLTRKLLEMTSYEKAVAFLHEVTHSSGTNCTVSTPNRVGAFECSPNKVVEYRARPDGLRVCHTNHPLANDDIASFEELKNETPGNNWVRGHGNSCSRFASMAARTVYRDGPIALDDLKAALKAKDDPENPVCRDLSTDINASLIAYTAGSMIYELGQNSKLHLAAGPPSESEFLTFEFSRKFTDLQPVGV
jgi:predicted choloylglycine hydrolase